MTKHRLLVTGADGFTGRFLVDSLAARGWVVHGLVHHLPATPVPGLHRAWEADLTDEQAVVDVLAQVRPTHVAHLAAIAFVAHGDVEAVYRTNLIGSRHLMQALTALPERPQAVLLASSANIYGNSTAGTIDESVPPAPANDYAVSKLAMEYMARLYAERLPLVIARPFNYTGHGQSLSFLLPKIVDHVRRRAEVIELGNIDVARDFCDVRMVVAAYGRLLETPGAVGGTFNVCSGKASTLREVLDLACGIAHHRMEVRVNPAFVRTNEVKVLQGSRQRLDACIGPLQSYALRETLAWMVGA